MKARPAHDSLLLANPMDDEVAARPSHAPGRAEDGVSLAVQDVADRIFVIRGRRVMVDVDLATLYGVSPKRLNEQVKRNHARFPDDFMFQLTLEEARALLASRSQCATLKRGRNIKYAPYAFRSEERRVGKECRL